MVAANLKLVSEKDNVRAQVPQEFQDRYDHTIEQDGVRIAGFAMLKPDEIEEQAEKYQSRTETYDHKHVTVVKSPMIDTKAWPQDMPPICVKHDGLYDKYFVISGHHRTKAASKAQLEEVPCFIMDFDQRADGLNAEEEFKQRENAHKPALPHNQRAAVKYLQNSRDSGAFDDELAIPDEKKRNKAIKDKAHDMLKEHYPNYTPQKRGKIVKSFLKNNSPTLIKSWTGKGVKKWFVNNNHLEGINNKEGCEYDYVKNKIDVVTQGKTIVTYPVGRATAKLRTYFSAQRADGVSEEKLRTKLKNLQIRVGVYFEADTAPNYESLVKKRQKVLEEAALMNRDNLVSPLVYSEIYFAFQSLQKPKEAPQPIVYRWDEEKQEYNLMEHV